MKIYYSPTSPFVRKCLVAAHELGLAGRIEKLASAAHPVARDATILQSNPLGQVPTFFCDDGTVLYDSRVICEYLDAQPGGGALFPPAGPARWRSLTEQSLADGMSGAAVLARYEAGVRPEPLRWADWSAGQLGKVESGLAWLQGAAPAFGDRVDIGTIALACTLSYLDLRFAATLDWRTQAPAAGAWYDGFFSRRASMQATALSG